MERHQKTDVTTYWNNYRLIRADHWRDAFQRAITFGRSDSEVGSRALRGETEFVGVTDLVPVYEPFEDGAEIFWEKYDSLKDDSDSEPPWTFSEEEMAAIYDEIG